MKIADDYYERYWKEEYKDICFGDIPVWKDTKYLNNLINFFKEGIKGNVLDAGCGSGVWVLNLAYLPQVRKIIGIDISKNAVEECIKNTKAKRVRQKVKFIKGSVTDLPFKKNFFDCILSIAVLEHILDIGKTFSEFNRVLKKGGYIGVLTVDFNLLKKVIIGAFFFERYFDPRSPHIRFFTKTTLKKIFEEYGFKVKRHRWTRSYFGIMPLAQLMLAQKVKDV